MGAKDKGIIGDRDMGENISNLSNPYPYPYLAQCQKEFEWPEDDMSLLKWYYETLGLNRFESEWMDQAYANEQKAPRSKYRTFRHRLAVAVNGTKGGAK